LLNGFSGSITTHNKIEIVVRTKIVKFNWEGDVLKLWEASSNRVYSMLLYKCNNHSCAQVRVFIKNSNRPKPENNTSKCHRPSS
jgi:hypothetical protein